MGAAEAAWEETGQRLGGCVDVGALLLAGSAPSSPMVVSHGSLEVIVTSRPHVAFPVELPVVIAFHVELPVTIHAEHPRPHPPPGFPYRASCL
jgi:hypothetical protein